MSEVDFLKIELAKIQEEYKAIVLNGSDNLGSVNYQLEDCLFFIDEIRRFWLERNELLKYCWDKITEQEDCFILSAAIYLQVSSYNQYSLKAVGDCQLLPDPFVKMENFMRAAGSGVNKEEVQRQFKSVVDDTASILNDYGREFMFVDASAIGAPSEAERMETINKGYDNFLCHIFQVEETDSLKTKFKTYDQIEEALPETLLDMLIFNDNDDADLCLGDRVELFIENQRQLADKHFPSSDFGRFSLAVFCLYSQALDTILKCTSLGIYPFFRNEVPVRYFYMLTMGSLEKEHMPEYIVKLIWKSIVGFFVGKEIEQLELNKISFEKYATYLREEKPYEKIINILNLNSDDVSQFDISNIANTVRPVIHKMKVKFNV